MALSRSDVSIIKAMLKRGDRQSDIASWFGVNSGRIAEISTGERHRDVPTASRRGLPPVGPYAIRDLYAALVRQEAR